MPYARPTLLLLGALLGCKAPGSAPTDSPSFPSDLRMLDALGATHLVLIHVDTLRGDHTPWYGATRDTFPTLRLRNWTVVDGYTSTTSWTGTATASVVSAATAAQHGVLYPPPDGGEGETNAQLQLLTLAEHLGGYGYATAVFAGNAYVGPASGVSRGFDSSLVAAERPMSSNAGDLITPVLDWLSAQPPGQPFFVMMQPIDPHMPYSPADEDYGTWSDTTDPLFERDAPMTQLEESYRAMLSDPATRDQARTELTDLYDEQLPGLDRALDKLIDGLDQMGLLDDTLVVLTADHGESLGEVEHPRIGHGMSFRPEVLRVPLLFLTPPAAPERLSCLSSGTDLAPTLVRAIGLPPMDAPDGLALQDGCREVTFSSFATSRGLAFAAARDADRMLLATCDTSRTEGLDLLADPFGRVTVDLSDDPLLTGALSQGLEDSLAVTSLGGCEALR